MHFPLRRMLLAGLAACWTVGALQAARQPESHLPAAAQNPAGATSAASSVAGNADSLQQFVTTYCVTCHNERTKTGQLVLEKRDFGQLVADAELWEKVIKKVRVGAMPPATAGRRPDPAARTAFVSGLEDALDRGWLEAPNPGRPPVHRLNRLQYTNAIRDLFGLEIDGRTLLPPDDTGFGFDNIGDVLSISPGLLDRYLLAASKISRLVVGDSAMRPTQTTYEVPYLSLGQDDRMSEELPFGSRGGAAFHHYFPLDGEYSIKLKVQRSDLADGAAVRGLNVENHLDLRLDRQRITVFALGSAKKETKPYGVGDGEEVDEGLEVRIPVKAGMHTVGVSFVHDPWDAEGVGLTRLPIANDAYSRGRTTAAGFGRIDMGLDRIEINGPFDGESPIAGAVRKRLFVCEPSSPGEEEPCARKVLATLARRAYRRPVSDAEVATLLDFYRKGRSGGTFNAGIQTALARLLVDINFLFRVERDPAGVKPGTPYRVSDLELASRLSSFLWSSIPDDELLGLASQGKLKDPVVLEQQVRRMLQDPKAKTLPDHFFGQWLTVKNLGNQRPDPKLFPEFDESLRVAFEEETRRFLASQLQEDRPATELLTANYTFVNERLAEHYGIPNIVGTHFRRVNLPDDKRAGLLGQGSILTVTSYNDRTSVVMRGKWILENVFGTPPTPPPPGVPQLSETKIEGSLRQRMEMHRKSAVCASCHAQIDPLGFGLENFDGVGLYRTMDSNTPVDASGKLVDGAAFNGPAEFRKALMAHQDAFLDTMLQKFMTYALGRGVETYDMPAVRKVLRDAAPNDYRWSSLILGIVRSMPFQMRRAES
jgi:hypothetical protein